MAPFFKRMTPNQHAGAATELTAHARTVIGADDDTAVSVNAHDCDEPGCCGARTIVLVIRILTETHGKRYAVIVNEFGEVGIDNDLIVNAEEEIFEMNNGCICCTVRGDLIRILGGLMRRKGSMDGIIVETTGLADPAP